MMLGRREANAKAPSVPEEDLFDEAFMRKLHSLALASRRVFRGRTRAERRSRKTGSGLEFADHRDYAPGDDIRFLDLNVYQRSEKLQLRLYEEEEDLSVHVLVDTSASMAHGPRSKLRYAQQLAAALSYVALVHLDRVSLAAASDGLRAVLVPTRGKNRIFRVLEFLRGLDARGDTDLGAAARAFTSRKPRRGLAIVISDFFDPRGVEAALDPLRFARFEVVALHLVDREDARPAVHGDLTLIDRETGATRDVALTPALLARFEAAHSAHAARIESHCRDKGIRYARVDVHEPFDEATLRLLREGGVFL
jgi:uncharacterized protein (DUF58 family)